MIIETIEHNGHIIELCHDDITGHDLNPFNDNDAMSAVVYSDQRLAFHNCAGIELPELTDEQCQDAAARICNVMGRAHHFNGVECLSTAIAEHFEYQSTEREKIESYFEVLKVAGVSCVLVNGHGSCQGDWHKILVMLDPDKLADYTDPDSALQGMAKGFELWAYGNVHGYQVFKQDTCKCCGHTALERIDSGWGFLCEQGDDTWQYMIECAKELT